MVMTRMLARSDNGSSSTEMSGYKLPWSRGAVENTSPGCWMNQEQNFNVEIKSFFVLLLIILCLFWRSEGLRRFCPAASLGGS